MINLNVFSDDEFPIHAWVDQKRKYFSGEAQSTRKWAEQIIPEFGPLRFAVKSKFLGLRKVSLSRANEWLRDAHKTLNQLHPFLRELYGPAEFEEKARWCALVCQQFESIRHLDEFSRKNGLPLVRGKTEKGRLRRGSDYKHWSHVFGQLIPRWRDQLMRLIGFVHKHNQIYCSDHSVRWQRSKHDANMAYLSKCIARSDQGDELTLAEIQQGSPSNPKVRFAELMMRCKGMEKYCAAHGYVALAITLTTPSKFHCRHAQNGDENPKYNRTTPKDAQTYLTVVFSRIRAALARRGVDWRGYRVVEAHHDGTPHWHFMVFIRTHQEQMIRDIFLRYGLAEDSSERGALKHRVKFERMDPERGSATAYMTKYIAKNIEGVPTEPDLFGNPAKEVAERVVAWAQSWGIRQFQFFGDASITVAREYWRIKPTQMHMVPPEHQAICRAISVERCWATYTELVGIGRHQNASLWREPKACLITGECTERFNKYGEPLTYPPIQGVICCGVFMKTRLKNWDIETPIGKSDDSTLPGASRSDAPLDLCQ